MRIGRLFDVGSGIATSPTPPSPSKIYAKPLLAALLLTPASMLVLPQADIAPSAIVCTIASHTIATLLILLIGLGLSALSAFPYAVLVFVAGVVAFSSPTRLQSGILLDATYAEVLLDVLRLAF